MLAAISQNSPLSLTIAVVAGVWVFVFGACIGSFLNVVAYRLPQGRTLIWEPSRCPKCGANIRPWHNLPVVGWLLLRGRCRDCGTPISLRYPLVEALAGGLLLALVVVELFSGGANLPATRPTWPQGAAQVLAALPWDLIAIVAYHAWLIYVLLAAALIRFDGQRVPRSLFVVGMLGAVLPALVAVVHPLPWQGPVGVLPVPAFGLSAAGADLSTAALGLLAGIVLAMPYWRLNSSTRRFAYSDGAMALVLLSTQLGWQTAVLVAALALALALCSALPVVANRWRQRWPLSASLLTAVMAVLLSWRFWSEHLFASGLWPAAIVAGYLLLVPLTASQGWLAPTSPLLAELTSPNASTDER